VPANAQSGLLAREAGGSRTTRTMSATERIILGSRKNVAIRATVRAGGTDYWSVFGRRTGADYALNYYSAGIKGGLVGLHKSVAGVYKVINESAPIPGFSSTDRHTVELRIQGDLLTITVDDKEVTRLRDDTLKDSGSVGLNAKAGAVIEKLEYLDLGDSAPPAAASTSTDKSQSLFNGTTLAGWVAGGDPASFKVEDGCIKAAGAKGNLIYTGNGTAPAWKDFDLSMKVRTGDKANSGVWVHCPATASAASAVALEVQIANDAGLAQMTGSLFSVVPITKQWVPNNQWFDLRVVVRGVTVTVYANSEKINEWTQPANWTPPSGVPNARLGSGSIGFQGYGGETWIKDVRIIAP